jgi:hypothetical protein
VNILLDECVPWPLAKYLLGLAYQQNLAGRRIAILLLSTNKLRRIVASATLIQSEIMSLQSAEYRHLEIP